MTGVCAEAASDHLALAERKLDQLIKHQEDNARSLGRKLGEVKTLQLAYDLRGYLKGVYASLHTYDAP